MIFNNPMFVEKIYYWTLDEMKEFCSARSKDPEESPQAKILYDQLKDYPFALQTHIIWEGIFSLMKTFKISREVEIKKNI